MKIVSVPKKEQITYYCDKCKKILKYEFELDQHSTHYIGEGDDHIQETISYEKCFLRRCTYREENEIVKREDLCSTCYEKKQKKYDKLVKSITNREKIKHRIIRFLSFSSPFLSVNINIGIVEIKFKYTKCRCGLCLNNGKDNVIMRNGKPFYYCDKHHTMIVNLLIRDSIRIYGIDKGGLYWISQMDEFFKNNGKKRHKN